MFLVMVVPWYNCKVYDDYEVYTDITTVLLLLLALLLVTVTFLVLNMIITITTYYDFFGTEFCHHRRC